MQTRPETHPSPDALQAFCLGKLEDILAETVLDHLETCADCRKEVAAQSGDSFLERLRQAHRPSNAPWPGGSLSDLVRRCRADNVTPPDPDRPATVLETEEDILTALKQGKPGTRSPEPPSLPARHQHAPRLAGNPYRPTVRPPIATLTLFDDGKTDGEAIRIRTDRFVIGRSEGDFRIPHDELISARHVEVTRQKIGEAYRWIITDLQTTNGMFVRVSRTVLADKAEFLVGNGRYRFVAPTGVLERTVDLPADARPSTTRAWETPSPTPQQPTLVELLTGANGARIPLVKSEYWIGSDPSCAVCRPEDPFVEPRHARLSVDANGVWHAQNNKSANGLWYRVPQIMVDDACLFQIGEQRLRLKAGG
jgi:pSer/pThr/pTyr-binding forkhead associated (FHA) protein